MFHRHGFLINFISVIEKRINELKYLIEKTPNRKLTEMLELNLRWKHAVVRCLDKKKLQ
jgi:hypothetical protein